MQTIHPPEPKPLAKPAKNKVEAPAKRKRDREGSTQALLEAAIAVFSEQGYDGATTREVAERAGVSEALIQRYFEGKAGLLLAIMQAFSDDEASQMIAQLPFKNTLEEEIIQVLERTCEIHKQHASFIRVAFSRAIVDPKLAQVLRTNVHERRMPALIARLMHYQQMGRINAQADIAAIAYGISAISFSLGFMGPEIFSYDRDTLRERGRSLAKVFAQGVK